MNQCQLEPPVGVHLLQHFTVLLQSGRVLRVHHVLHQIQCAGDSEELEVDVDRGGNDEDLLVGSLVAENQVRAQVLQEV